MQQDYREPWMRTNNSKMSLDAVTKPDQIKHVTEILEDGRYAVACVKARIAGEPLPVKRPPCFFNPAHGPSSQDVEWAPPGGVLRSVPACPADAERVLAGADPYIRTVQVGAQRVPYWEADGLPPWAPGYTTLARYDMISGVLIGACCSARANVRHAGRGRRGGAGTWAVPRVAVTRRRWRRWRRRWRRGLRQRFDLAASANSRLLRGSRGRPLGGVAPDLRDRPQRTK